MSDQLPTAGEASGIFAGIVGLMVALGKGVDWIFQHRTRRERDLDQREKVLLARQERYWAEIERELKLLQAQNRALHLAFETVVAPLRAMDPRNSALSRAEQILAAAFPLDADLFPPTFDELLARIDQQGE